MTRARNIAGFSTITTNTKSSSCGDLLVFLLQTRIDGEFNLVDLDTRDIISTGNRSY